ncbi:MAG: YicC/YloC family endoribonuclease [Shimia sp.]
MTGFASVDGQTSKSTWLWEMRGVNAKGLDIRLRLPDAFAAHERAIRSSVASAIGRGNVQVSLKCGAVETEGGSAVDHAALDALLDEVALVAQAAAARGVTAAAPSTLDLLMARGVRNLDPTATGDEDLQAQALDGLQRALAAFVDMRLREGGVLRDVLSGQLDEIAALTQAASEMLPDRAAAQRQAIEAGLARLKGMEVDDARIAQDVALLLVKGDVMEEIDRLTAHIGAARELLDASGPVGRRLDFLMQEFNREANTLCSKAAHGPLTEIGLALKVVIDQMREQVQNVE